MSTNSVKSIHNFKIEGLKGAAIDFSAFAGKKILLVNVASECGLTPQYSQLEELYRSFSDKFVVVGCPANNFGAQEPGDDATIQQFCSTTYGVTFPMTTKISVKGNDMHALYQFVTQQAQNGVEDTEVAWNFQKYVFDEQGNYVQMFGPQTDPADEQILNTLGVQL